MKQGPDLSHYNTVDLDRLAARSDFVIIKATEGTSVLDPTFRSRWARLGQLHKPRVAYHFARPSGGDATDEGRWFVRQVANAGWRPNDGLMLDFEDPDTRLSADALWRWAATWVQTVRGLLPHARPVLFYTYPSYWFSRMGNPARPIPATLLDWARYSRSGPDPTPKAYPSPPAVWQSTNGVVGKVHVPGLDWNEMTDDAFARLFGQEEDDLTKEEHEALMWLRNNLARVRDQGVRMTDHGEPDVPGRSNHLERVRADIAALASLVQAGVPVRLDLSTASPQQIQDLGNAIADRLVVTGVAYTGTIELTPKASTP